MGIKKLVMFIIFSVIFSCFLIPTSLASSNSLKQGDVLNSTSHLVSAGNNFTLGFLSLPSDSNNTYLGIWHTHNVTTKHHPVWVGNRNSPIKGNSGVLTIDGAAMLIIKHDAGEPIVLYAGQNQSILIATLLDNGNFVVGHLNASGFVDEEVILFDISEAANHNKSNISTSNSGNTGDKKWIWIVLAVVGALVMLALVLWCCLRRKIFRLPWVHTNEEKVILQVTTPNEYTDTINEDENEVGTGHDLKQFGIECIEAATNCFSTKLGEGGFGPVYKGKFPNGQDIAVKQLSRSSEQGLPEFKNELIIIAKLQHKNLVCLLGYCIHGDEKMLIYEYMTNKSLDCFLFDPTQRERLTWEIRFSIIEGIAQGVIYLHIYSRLKIIHRDLKASNILLDENMNPKISDFGMARIFKQNVREANTKRAVGTLGYMAPEYALEGTISVKSDVFSFGVLMLEIVSGRKNNSFNQTDDHVNLVGYAWELWNKGNPLELADSTLIGSCNTCQVLRCIHVGLLCVQDCARDRPIMSKVGSMITNDLMDLPMPKRPAYVARNSVVDDDLNLTPVTG